MKKMIKGIFVFITLIALSWLIFCGMFYIIAFCFSFEFSWKIATGFWLIWVMVRALFSGKKE